MFLGLNESGKSNILEAMSFFETPEGEFNYQDYHNQKDEGNNPVAIWFSLDFDTKDACVKEFRTKIEVGGDLLSFEITEIIKNVYLNYDETAFYDNYDFNVNKLTSGLFVKTTAKNVALTASRTVAIDSFTISKTAGDDGFIALDITVFKKLFSQKIEAVIQKFEPSVTFWKPSKEYLISTENLIEFAADTKTKLALKNIFLLAGYDTEEKITSAVDTIQNGQQRSRLKSKLEESLDNYIKEVWKHNIDVVIDITETGQFTLSIRDSGESNRHDRLPINGRSEGARHFLSLILSLSIESKHNQRKNQLILIDEPETHLHPSGIRDLRDELLKIGKNNYVYVSTHSPFLVDRKNKERNVIIKKNSSALTEKFHIENHTNIIDDEVLQEAFGLEAYKDLLNPHSILVEGASDKVIIQKVLNLKGKQGFGITNGHGSNIDTLAAKLNDTDISPLVVLDDDKDGKTYKTKIIRSGGSYSADNVVTIRDLVGKSVDGGTIEDFLGKNYVESTFKNVYKSFYNEVDCDVQLIETQPFVRQMKAYVQIKSKTDIENFIELVKNDLAQKLELSKGSFAKNFPLLDTLVDEIIKKLNVVK
jgi:predicted ATP-dependent endonuclease of OLD family